MTTNTALARMNIGIDCNGNPLHRGDVCRIVPPSPAVRAPGPDWLGVAGVVTDRFPNGRSGCPRVVFRPICAPRIPDEIYVWTPALELLPGREQSTWPAIETVIGWHPAPTNTAGNELHAPKQEISNDD
jgi:hypothetical protein